MVRLGVVADSHGRDVWLEAFAERCEKERYDAVFHLGDFESDARWLERHIDMPVIAVPGNCDMTSKSSKEVLATFGGRRLLAEHGHRHDVKYTYQPLSYYAEERGADAALFGHTHVPCAEWMGCVLLMNPGALMNGQYGELLIDDGRLVPLLKSFRKGR